MKKRIDKHIKEQNYVKVYLADDEGMSLTHFNGILLDHNESFLFMSDLYDFFPDGFIVLRKSDISEIKYSKNEVFFSQILEKEKIKEQIIQRATSLKFKLTNLPDLFNYLLAEQMPVIIERKYHSEDVFQLGTINRIEKKKVFIDYISANGEYDLKPVRSKFKDITFVRFGCTYSLFFKKYAERVD